MRQKHHLINHLQINHLQKHHLQINFDHLGTFNLHPMNDRQAFFFFFFAFHLHCFLQEALSVVEIMQSHFCDLYCLIYPSAIMDFVLTAYDLWELHYLSVVLPLVYNERNARVNISFIIPGAIFQSFNWRDSKQLSTRELRCPAVRLWRKTTE